MGNVATSPQKILYGPEKKIIRDLIKNNCVVVFSKSQCIYCKKVKKLFNDSNISYFTVELDKRDDGPILQAALQEITGVKTGSFTINRRFDIMSASQQQLSIAMAPSLGTTEVPRVFINGECIGGCSESEELSKQNKLLEKVSQCSNGNL